MDNAGHLIFGVYNGGAEVDRQQCDYNDNAWHQVVGDLSSAGRCRLYVDGARVARDQALTTAASPTRATGGSAVTT